MSTLKVNNIESFTASDPLTITDANGLQVNSSITSSGDISASGAITALSFTGNLIGTSTIETSGLISSSAGVSASNITAAGNLTAGTITVNSNLTALNDIIVTGLVSSSGPESGVSASALTVEGDLNVNGSLNISLDTQNTSNDLATDAEYSVNGTKVEVRAITAAQIDDGTFATFKLLNTSIGVNDIVVGGFNGSHSNTNISSSILTATVIAAKTASVFIHNETGAAIAADTPFTASFIVL